MARLWLVAVGDDFLLEEALNSAVREAVEVMAGAPVEKLSSTTSPEELALEINSPSLFSPERVLLLPEIHEWLELRDNADDEEGRETDTVPGFRSLLRILREGLPEGVALVLGALCMKAPQGDLVKIAEKKGEFRWIPLPEPPKPWEESGLSAAQTNVLRSVMRQAAPDARLEPKAEKLLCERLGFAPRRLAMEVKKLEAASGGKSIPESLVRRLVLPREASIEIFQDCLLNRDAAGLAAFLDLVRRDIPIRGFSGETLSGNPAFLLFNIASSSFMRMFYLREIAQRIGVEDELSPGKNGARGWYQRVFKTGLAPRLIKEIGTNSGAPFRKSPKPSPWALHTLFRAAGRYPMKTLRSAVEESALIDVSLRLSYEPLAPLPSWLMRAMKA